MDFCVFYSVLIVQIISCLSPRCVLALRLTRIDVPSSVIMGDPVWLNCSFELENDDLYSVKWYHSKGESSSNEEFYRWIPKDTPPGQEYSSQGIYLDLSKSSNGNVYLTKTDLHTDGTFKCEVSAESPSFQTVRKEKELRVYSLPKEGPTITGIRAQHYGIGDLVNVTCHAGPSKPQSTLSWTINDYAADNSYVRFISPPKPKDGLQESALQLQFNAERQHFLDGRIKLRCTSVISQAYSMSSEEIIVSDHDNVKASHIHSVHEGEGPIISGGRPSYNIGDIVNLTCTSSKSDSAPQLKFYINEHEARAEYLQYYQIQYSDGKEYSMLGLKFIVDRTHFRGSSNKKRTQHNKDNSQLRLKCTATSNKVIATNSRETIIGSSRQSSGLHIAENKAVNYSNGCIKQTYSLLSSQTLVLLICSWFAIWCSRV